MFQPTPQNNPSGLQMILCWT